ncbi:MAG TPA: amylo-alpha-1,6-glucosidase [Stellaceae bacterium]|nr:amylo-alpha-1,6-glucosidase [Stellaceae bacterium]
MSASAPDRLAGLLPIRFGREICGDLAAAERREWWLANGRGGYAAGTVALSLTRRYHALLVAPVDPPLGRVLVLAKADATLDSEGRRYPLFTNRWASGAVAPAGHLLLESFHLDGTVPVWRFRCGGRLVEHRIWMEHGADTVYAAWRLEDGPDTAPAELRVTLLANGRDHHSESWPPGFAPEVRAEGPALTVAAPGRFTLAIRASGGSAVAASDWYEDFDLPVERERGLPTRDSHRHVGDLALTLTPGEWAGFAATLSLGSPRDGVARGWGSADPPDLSTALARRRDHDRTVLERAIAADPVLAAAPPWVLRLVLAADLYVIDRPVAGEADGRSVIAGYPWFGDWGRDTMIALPGLCLATGRFDDARAILETFARFVDRGMLPNVFPGAGGVPEYNTVDAALWYIEAWRAYVTASGDEAALGRAFPVLAEIVSCHLAGTRYGIGVDPADGLLHAGEEGVQLTWMDARVGDWVVTPRIGKPVEINALWYNALRAMAALAERLGRPSGEYRAAASRAQAGFARFIREGEAGLYDIIDGPGGSDPRLRPNQILALSLWASPLDPATQAAVLRRCAAALLTSYGLRSLAPGEPDYHGRYEGGVVARDGGYHQGPVWPWLMGPYALAHYRVHGDAAAAQHLLRPIGDHLLDAGLGQVSEILDGDPPHTPRGCPAQAWSVATVLEAWRRLEAAKAGKG